VTCEVNGGLEIVEVRRPAVVTTDLRLDEPVTMEKDKIPAGGYSAMTDYPEDVYTEPSDFDVHTLKNLGPLTGLAGIWQGTRSLDVNPKAEGPEEQVFVERIELQPIDPQTNGPQLFYGLRYHTHIVKPGEVETYHDQVGYWLWEPATGNLIQTLAIPRGQIGRHELRARGRARLRDERNLLESIPRICLQDHRVPDQGHDQPRRHLGLRRGHCAYDSGQDGAVSPRRSKCPHQGRRADSQSAREEVTSAA